MICIEGKSIPCRNFVCQTLQIAAGGDVSKPDFICQSGDELVAAGGEGGGDTMVASGETGENQETTVGERLLPIGRKAHVLQTAGGTDNDGLTSAQKDAETFLLHRRMKTADNAMPFVAPFGSLIIGGEYDFAGATGGTEHRGFGESEQVKVAASDQRGW